MLLVATFFLPVMWVTGDSMEPTLQKGDVVIGVASSTYEKAQVIGFNHHRSMILKRIIAKEGDWVSMDDEGYVTVNSIEITEPYVFAHSAGISDITYPFQVPEHSVFVLGDHRSTSIDS
ncbi:MAG: signal peptidase I [Clostridiales bacterium]|nr:signal peptidase I [Clostridiales bacterium]